jgi:glycolate oxidase iron-sulfur subunit
MKTGFSSAQLNDPRMKEADGILRACVHCGFCGSACPTYAVTGDERDSPRGRIWLIRDLLESEGPPEEEAVVHLDRCLECLACMPACPSGVDYGHLIATAREEIESRGRRSWRDRFRRWALLRTLTDTAHARRLFALARSLRFLASLTPSRVAAALRLASALPKASAAGPRAGVYPAGGARKGRVGVLRGCVQAAVAPGINAALIRILNRARIEVVVFTDADCCGALDKHLGRGDVARARARAVIAAVLRERSGAGLDAVVQTSSGCGTMIKDYGHLLGSDAAWASRAAEVSALARDASQVLAALDLAFRPLPRPLVAAWQPPCSLSNGQRVTAEPPALLRAAGFTVIEPDDGGYCCGSAGVYNVLEADMAATLGDRKAAALGALDADVVVSGNVGCMAQLAGRVAPPVVHLVEILDWASGGPSPPGLQGQAGGGGCWKGR